MAPGFQPFFDRFPARFPSPLLGRLLLVAGFSIGFFAAGFKALAGLIAASMIALYYAADRLRGLFRQMDMRLEPRTNEVYLKPLLRTLTDRNMVMAGIFFGVLNISMGYAFGPPYDGVKLMIVYAGFFVVGFTCGMAAYGIYGVIVMIDAFAGSGRLNLDYTEPDRCGGLGFLGRGLVRFSSVTLIGAMLISWYIHHTSWTNLQHPLVTALMWFWIAFPFILSLVVLLVPGARISLALEEYKVRQGEVLQGRLAELRARLEDPSLAAVDRDVWRQDYEHLRRLREELYRMQTSPCNVASGCKYVGIFLSNAVVAALNVSKLLGISK